jgi:hypothetical protein
MPISSKVPSGEQSHRAGRARSLPATSSAPSATRSETTIAQLKEKCNPDKLRVEEQPVPLTRASLQLRQGGQTHSAAPRHLQVPAILAFQSQLAPEGTNEDGPIQASDRHKGNWRFVRQGQST